MFKLTRLPPRLKAMLMVASAGLACGDMLPVIVISSLFGAAHPGFATKLADKTDPPPTRSVNADQPFSDGSLNKIA